jgi:hypothetical protein
VRRLERSILESVWEGSQDVQHDARRTRARSEAIIRESVTMRDRLARQAAILARAPAGRRP